MTDIQVAALLGLPINDLIPSAIQRPYALGVLGEADATAVANAFPQLPNLAALAGARTACCGTTAVLRHVPLPGQPVLGQQWARSRTARRLRPPPHPGGGRRLRPSPPCFHTQHRRHPPSPRPAPAALVLAAFCSPPRRGGGPLLAARLDDATRAPSPRPPACRARAGGDALSAVTGSAKTLEELQARVAARPDDPRPGALLGLAYLQRARETSDPCYYTRADALLRAGAAARPRGVRRRPRPGLAGALAPRLPRRAAARRAGARPVAGGSAERARDRRRRADRARPLPPGLRDVRPAGPPAPVPRRVRPPVLRLRAAGRPGARDRAHGQAVQAGAGGPENTQWTRVQLGHLLSARAASTRPRPSTATRWPTLPNYARAEAGLGSVAVARGDLASRRALVPVGGRPPAAGRDRDRARRRPRGPRRRRRRGRRLRPGPRDGDALRAGRRQRRPRAGAVRRRPRAARRRPRRRRRPGPHGAGRAARPSSRTTRSAGRCSRPASCDAALPEARAATALGTADPQVLYHLGAIAACAGDEATARDALSRALASNPRFHPLDAPAAQSILDRLGRP